MVLTDPSPQQDADELGPALAHVRTQLEGRPIGYLPLVRSFLAQWRTGRADVLDRCVEPHIEDLGLESGPVHRHTPGQVAGDPAVFQAPVEPLQGDRGGQHRPALARGDPLSQFVGELGLLEVQVPAVANLQVVLPLIADLD
jgi:hypothetical protein